MKKMIYRTEEKFRRPEVVSLLTLFSALLIHKVIVSFGQASTGLGMTEIVLLSLLFGSAWLSLLYYKMGIRISKKSLKVQYNSIFKGRGKFLKKDVEFLEFVQVPETAMWNGMSVSFENANRFQAHGMGDNSGMRVRMKSGKNVFIYCNDMYKRRDELSNELNAAGWTVK